MSNSRCTVRCRRLWLSIHLVYIESLLKMVGQVWKGRDIYVDCPIYPWMRSWLLHWTWHWLESEGWCAARCLGEATCAWCSEGSHRNCNMDTQELMNFNTLPFDKKLKGQLNWYSDWATHWMTEELRFNNSRDKRILSPSKMSQRALCPPLPSVQWVLGSLLPGIKLPVHDDCSFLPSTKVKNVQSYTSPSPICFYNIQRDNFSFITSWFWFWFIFIISRQFTIDETNQY